MILLMRNIEERRIFSAISPLTNTGYQGNALNDSPCTYINSDFFSTGKPSTRAV